MTEPLKLSLWKRLLFMAIAIAVIFSGVEIGLRLTGFTFSTGTYELIEGDVIEYHWSTRGLIRDPSLPWSWMPGPDAEATQPARNDFKYNSHGFRGPEVTKRKDPDTIRVICMGDSCTLGWDSPENETYPDFLRKSLEKLSSSHFEVINAGVSGFSSFQGLHDFHQRIKKWQPDILIVSYNWNDHGDAPDRVYGPAVFTPRERRQFTDKDMPANTASYDLKRQAQKIRIVQAMTKLVWTIQGRNLDEPKLAINEKGDVSAEQSAFPPGTGLRRVEPEDYRLNLWEFRRLANQEGIELIFLTQPSNPVQHHDIEPWKTYYSFQDQYNKIIRKVARKSETPLVDPLATPWLAREHFYDHVHTRPDANRKIADMVLQEVILATGRLSR